ncbi:hypothetical protein ASL83_003302 [Vibrio parahaemolyticus]|jgi:hypothetical protein|uniref:Uncharacterized protein n=1 Tax=Vibrio parahaemolyticus TaxID=670 RepID=A0A9Q3YHD9_VIBPH|nr:hypothetical protein [Vibrio parahaemolyticus]EJE4724534.1 hypothetical protein [Vibrio parahaemolyticus]EJO2025808.1 hypothetical protein [Vibrio parahaemolyticus]ELA8177596.1 hypothetical protein [Vibrio alginolyticus]MCC3803728.1 hypothetical protein [Vibrio parahaemolyticus]
MLLYNDLTQRITNAKFELIDDLSESRVLARLNKRERLKAVQKFCAFKFPGQSLKSI